MKSDSRNESGRRGYRSELRAEQADATARRILDATERRLVAGDRELSYAAIAREARVSVPTVYRHFPTRQELFRAIHLRIEPRLADGLRSAEELDLHEIVLGAFRRYEDGPVGQAGRLNTLWEFSRATTVPLRRQLLAREIERRCPHLAEPHRTWLIDVGVVLISTATAEAFRGYLELDAAAASERVAFVLEALFAAQSRTTEPEQAR